MSRTFVQVIADDLTGALDAAAPFATPHRPMRLLTSFVPTGDISGLAGLAVSSESRDLEESRGDAAVERAFDLIAQAGVPEEGNPLRFAKIDSVLRGRPVAETLLRMRLWEADTCLFAPAFPDMGRRTVEGRHEALINGVWRPAAVHDLAAAFRDAGTKASVRRPNNTAIVVSSGVIVGDASDARHLVTHVEAFRDRSKMVWAGSRGLAQALAGSALERPLPRIDTIVVGTTHSTTRCQVACARTAGLFERVRLIDPVPESSDASSTRARVAEGVANFTPGLEQGVFVVGGDTLAAVLAAIRAKELDCEGEILAGVPVSRIRGGLWDGVRLVTKSGGFGGTNLLAELLAQNP